MAPSTKTIVAFRYLHPLAEVDLLHFVNNFHPKMDLVLDRKALIYVLTRFSRLSSNDPLGLVYELL
jgi:hypothetical protein